MATTPIRDPSYDPEKAPWMPPVINNVAQRKSNTISDAEIREGTARSAAENKARRDAWNKAHPSKTYTPGKKKEVLPLPKPASSKPKAVMPRVTLTKPGKNTLTVGPARAPIPAASNKGKSSAASVGSAKGPGSPNPKTPAKVPSGAKPQPMPRIKEGPNPANKVRAAANTAAAAAKRNSLIGTVRAAMPKTPAATATQKANWAMAKSNAGSAGRAMGMPATPKATPKQTAAWNAAKGGGARKLFGK